VNLIYAAYHERSSPKVFLAGLFDDLSSERVEIDVLELNGPMFGGKGFPLVVPGLAAEREVACPGV
jgi:hypothetical protein